MILRRNLLVLNGCLRVKLTTKNSSWLLYEIIAFFIERIIKNPKNINNNNLMMFYIYK